MTRYSALSRGLVPWRHLRAQSRQEPNRHLGFIQANKRGAACGAQETMQAATSLFGTLDALRIISGRSGSFRKRVSSN
jgi:hypothetical protein